MLIGRRYGSGNPQFYLTDHLGSATTLLNSSGGKSADMRYDPWGEERWVETALPHRFRFTGQRYDDALDLYDYQARYYDPSTGRFISADSIIPNPGNPQAFNRYAYTLNNPVRYIDPSGHCVTEDETAGGTCTPVPPPPPPPPTDYQNSDAVYSAIPLSEEEFMLLVVAVWSESSNGTHSREAMTMMAWVFLNKKAINQPGADLFNVINPSSQAWNELGQNSAIRDAIGDMPSDDAGKRAWLLAVYDMYTNGSTKNAERFAKEVVPLVQGVYESWLSNGSNSAADPTHGSVFFSHQSNIPPGSHYRTIEERFAAIANNFYALALKDPTFSYALSDPYSWQGKPTMTVTGTTLCVTFGSCAP